MIPKNKPGRSTEYLDYIRSRPCWVCQAKPIEPHHTGSSGVGMKSSDFSAIPLCNKHHRELHDRGVKTFQKERKVNISTIVAVCLIKWADMNWADKEE